ncbi:unnamed protein product [Prunus armeniaca]|uniref:Uncharacterized protein n=1 Tax=Prunus armeniaca TaxID=36596 RepID=A0A6J5TU39_PRUAR|nr:unnamed protein product [Prunus armeniaca]
MRQNAFKICSYKSRIRPDQRGCEGIRMSHEFWVNMGQDLQGQDGGDKGNHAHGLHPTKLENGEKERSVFQGGRMRKMRGGEGRGGVGRGGGADHLPPKMQL